tara:strand:+ start:1184 stop:1627 length:444 start_codon:yes stop_codon:yes gene_type:complete
MNIEKLREELKVDEGCINEIYLDHLGYHTFGIGHLITDKDKEWGDPVGTKISTKRINECFKNDIEIVFKELDRSLSWWRELPEDIQLVLANMCFNLGITRLKKFKKFLAALSERNWELAATEMMDSRWATQVKQRAVRLQKRVLKGG